MFFLFSVKIITTLNHDRIPVVGEKSITGIQRGWAEVCSQRCQVNYFCDALWVNYKNVGTHGIMFLLVHRRSVYPFLPKTKIWFGIIMNTSSECKGRTA